jgi:hypothetical protein
MIFDIKASNIILVIFKWNFFSTKCFFSTHLCLFEWKTCLDVFCEITWIKLFNCNWNGTIIHIQYMTKHFIKIWNYLNHFLGMFAFCNILWQTYIFSQIYFYSFNINQKSNFLWQLHYFTIEWPYFECNLWKPLLILVWWKLKVAQFWKTIFVTTFFGHHT